MKGLTAISVILFVVGVESRGLRPRGCRSPLEPVKPCKKWFHDDSLNRCKHVEINTCAKGDNAFFKADCQITCGKYRSDKPFKPRVCSKEERIIPCMRKYYDVIENKCKVIPWQQNECLTGQNAWMRTDRACNDQCIRPIECFTEPDIRPCQRIYATVQDGVFVSCQKYGDGMCADGTNNAFPTKEECKAECKVENPPSKCSELPTFAECRIRYYEPDKCVDPRNNLCAYGINSFTSRPDCNVCLMGGDAGDDDAT